jgi:hypothetical protein
MGEPERSVPGHPDRSGNPSKQLREFSEQIQRDAVPLLMAVLDGVAGITAFGWKQGRRTVRIRRALHFAILSTVIRNSYAAPVDVAAVVQEGS